jgi:hypothetical protein
VLGGAIGDAQLAWLLTDEVTQRRTKTSGES